MKVKKIGLVGFGNVARRVAELIKGFDMEIFVYSKYFSSIKDQFSYIKSLSLKEIITSCDIISFHCKPTDNGKSLVNLNELNKMKKTYQIYILILTIIQSIKLIY